MRVILENPGLTELWRTELEEMRVRVGSLRTALAAAEPRLAAIAAQRGLFAILPIDAAAVAALRADHGIYMAGSGRINVAGLHLDSIARFAAALAPYLPA